MQKTGMGKKGANIDKDAIRELAELLIETGLTEIEIERDGSRLRVARTLTMQAPVMASASPAIAPQVALAPESAMRETATHPGAVNSPMVGTAYRAPEPGAAPFVDIGTDVAVGQTLMIVEAMKTMNQIPSPRAGKITAVLIEDGQPVEFGQPLVIIE